MSWGDDGNKDQCADDSTILDQTKALPGPPRHCIAGGADKSPPACPLPWDTTLRRGEVILGSHEDGSCGSNDDDAGGDGDYDDTKSVRSDLSLQPSSWALRISAPLQHGASPRK
jgi:hypothetical protein